MKRSSLAFALLLACSQTPEKVEPDKPAEPTTPEQPQQAEPLAPKDGFFMAEGAPEPRACKVADDCTANTIPDVNNPCCQNPTTLEPYAQGYWWWVGEWRGKNCAAVTCPPPPPPSQPPECALKLDCVDGVCVDACP
jgi:hypothetical protein